MSRMRMLLATGAAATALGAGAGPAGSQDAANPELRCPAANCPPALIGDPGPMVDNKTGRRFFLDVPKNLKPGEDVVVVLNLHGGGSYGNWQRHYFPIVDFKDKHRLVVITPNAPPRVWRAEDDEHLRNVVDMTYERFGRENIKAFWLAGHSQGGATSRRIVCQPYFAERVTGFVSLSGGRVGGQPGRPQGAGRPPQRGETPPAAPPAPSATSPSAPAPAPACDFSHIYSTGEHEITGLPATSEWAAKYGCGPRVKRRDVVDTKPGYVFDSSRQDPATKSWGRLPKGGKAEVYVYPNCRGGRVVADVVRIDKGHTEGLEPKVTEEIVKLMLSAKS